MGTLRRLSNWLAWGALGPLLLLIAYLVLERGLDWLHLEPGVTLVTVAGAAQVLAALSLAVIGVLSIVRAQMSWRWAGAAMAATWALIVGANFAAAGIGRWALENSGLWTVLAALLGLYAYHCHVPGYWWWRAEPPASTDSNPAKGGRWRGWTVVDLVLGIVVVASTALYVFGAGIGAGALQTAGRSPQAANAASKPAATWASFATGSNLASTTLNDGLRITDVHFGTGTTVGAGDALSVRFIMWFGSGKQADSSDAEGGPFHFTLGAGEVIKGWEEGVPGMRVGGIRRLVIPPALLTERQA